jgi:hypothetical protein
MASDREGWFDIPSPRRHSMGALPSPTTTVSRSGNTLVAQPVARIPLQQAAPWPDTDLPFER